MMRPLSGIAIFVVWGALLLLPLAQHIKMIIPEKPLKGAIEHVPYQPFSFAHWFDGTWQEKTEAFLMSEFGFRSTFIRLHNQLKYWIYNEFSANGVVIGKDRYMYEESYLNTYYGLDFKGNDTLLVMAEKLKRLQNILNKQNKLLLVVLAPGKGYFYPEYIPNDLQRDTTSMTNYKVLSRLLRQNEINHIDFQDHFKRQKDRSLYPLYPQFGIHWSYYGMCIAADSMARKIESLLNLDLPEISIQKENVKVGAPQKGDYDIGEGINLMFQFPTYAMAYPTISFGSKEGKDAVASIVIADSFYWGLFNLGFSNLFSTSQFWYYNHLIFPKSYGTPSETKDVDLNAEIKSAQVFILLSTDANLKDLGWGFVERSLEVLKGNQDID